VSAIRPANPAGHQNATSARPNHPISPPVNKWTRPNPSFRPLIQTFLNGPCCLSISSWVLIALRPPIPGVPFQLSSQNGRRTGAGTRPVEADTEGRQQSPAGSHWQRRGTPRLLGMRAPRAVNQGSSSHLVWNVPKEGTAGKLGWHSRGRKHINFLSCGIKIAPNSWGCFRGRAKPEVPMTPSIGQWVSTLQPSGRLTIHWRTDVTLTAHSTTHVHARQAIRALQTHNLRLVMSTR
jgi:hypothetical protein